MSHAPVVECPCPLAIVGLSCLFPKAPDVDGFWSNIRRGVDAITEIPSTHWRPDDYFDADPKRPDMTYARRGGFLSPVPFDPLEFGIAPSNLEAIDTSQLLGLVASKRALDDAGYGENGKPCDRSRIGCILGVTGTLEMVIPLGARLGHPKWRQALRDAGVADDVAQDVIDRISESYVPWQENSFPGLLGNVVAGRIANRLDLGGTNCVVDAACASSLSAMHLAALELWSGRAEMVLTGGIDTFNDIFMYMCFSKTPALSPSGDARPFAEAADGTILGEGVGVFVLKRLNDAERDGDRIYAVIRGIGTSSDGAGNAVYAPKKEGQIRCLRDAYRIAGVSPDTIELVEAHGTGTKVGDATEAAALNEVYRASGRSGRWCALGSVKSQIGHTKAAAGAAGVMKAVLALAHRVLPPTIKVDRPQDVLLEEGSPFYVNTQPRPWLPSPEHPRRAGVSAFGFGGSNFHCVLEESPRPQSTTDWDGDVVLAAFSGESLADVTVQLQRWQPSGWPAVRHQAAVSRAAFKSRHEHRLVLVLERDRGDVAALVSSAVALLDKYADRPTWSTPDGVFYGRGAAGRLAVLFPGQGSQAVGMVRELACRFPVMQDVLAEANAAFVEAGIVMRLGHDLGRATASRLSDHIYPPPEFTAAAREAQDAALRDTQVAQPALGAVSLGTLAVLEQFGVKPEITGGHSYGELTALCASKRIQRQALYRLSMLRGRLMAEAQEVEGGMIAVGAPLSQVEAAIREAAVDLVVANRNAPNQVVLSGRLPDIDRAVDLFAQKNIRGKKLAVSAAFHSPLVAPASDRFRPELEDVEFADAEVPVFANSSGREYPADSGEARDLLAGQLAKPVEFVGQIENMYAAGARTFLEVGPGSVLTGLVGSILSGREFRAIAVDASSGKRGGLWDLGVALAQLAVGGHAVRLSAWDPAPPLVNEDDGSRMRIPLSGANYVKPRAPRPSRVKSAPTPQHGGVERVAPSAAAVVLPKAAPLAPAPLVTVAPRPMTVAAAAIRPEIHRQSAQVTALPAQLVVLQKMQEETAQLHRQFLEGQDAALRVLASLLGTPAAAGPVSAPAPMPMTIERGSAEVRGCGSAGVREWGSEPTASTPLPSPLPQPSASATSPTPPHSHTPAPLTPAPLTPIVLGVVAEKTGYPVEMLQPKMSLDHDLGIDSIKRVEILSALQEKLPHLPAVTPEQLQTLHRLSDVIALLEASAGVAECGGEPNASTPLPQLFASATFPTPTHSHTPAPLTPAPLTPIVLGVVAEKTGYPVEMLQPKMSLDHDLGIDSIKRVEILSALQEKLPHLPAVTPEQLQTLHRLSDVIALLEASAGVAECGGEPNASTPLPSPLPQPSASASSPTPPRFRTPALLRGEVRVIPLSDASRERLPLPAGGEIWITDDGGNLALALARQLTAAGFKPRIFPFDAPTVHQVAGGLAGLVILAPVAGMSDRRLWCSLEWLQTAGRTLQQTARQGRAAIVATVSRLDGALGFAGDRALSDPASGGLAGLTKTVRHEWPQLTCKAIDLGGFDASGAAAEALCHELLHAGPVEVGLSPAGAVTLAVTEAVPSEPALTPLSPGDLVLVSGGARGVTAAAALALARELQPRMVLLGRSPAPTVEPDWLRSLTTEAQIKQGLAKFAGVTAPRAMQQQYQQIIAQREVSHTLDAMQETGTPADYHCVDIRDISAVCQLMDTLQRAHGPVRGVIHGAGVLADQRIEEKTREQFDRVFDTKVIGLRNLLGAISADELKVLALFSSFTGRFGRTGQIDYAIANEVLNKTAQQFRRQHPACRVVSFNWGPWDGGMVQGGLRALFAKEGVGLIPLDAGADLFVQELRQPATAAVEVLVLGPGSTPLEKMPGGSDINGTSQRDIADKHVDGGVAESPVVTTGPSLSDARLAFEREISFAKHLYLRDHVIGGKGVFPVALIAEFLAHAAMYRNPGLQFFGFDQFKILRGVRVDRDEAVRLQVWSGRTTRASGRFCIPTQLTAPQPDRPILHAAADVWLADVLPAAELPRLNVTGDSVPLDGLYKQLFHGSQLRGLERIEAMSAEGIVVFSQTATASPADWIRDPLRSAWLADPLAVDGALQAAIVWSLWKTGTPCLPSAWGRYRQFRRTFPRAGVRISFQVTHVAEHLIRADIEFCDSAGQLVARAEDCENVVDPSLTAAFQHCRV